jgi:type I restriction-modification system DNA methylase subunit
MARRCLLHRRVREFEQGTNQNRLRPSDIDTIVNTYRNRKEIAKYSHRAKHAEIVENEFNLNIPRYVDTFEPEPEIDVAAVQREIEEIGANSPRPGKKCPVISRNLGSVFAKLTHQVCLCKVNAISLHCARAYVTLEAS